MVVYSLESIKYLHKNVIDTLTFHEFEDEIFIGLIKIIPEHRRKGHGTKILNLICEYADENNKIITLTPLYRDTQKESSGNSPIFNLEDFYIRKFGFIVNELKNEIPHLRDRLYRLPTKNKNNKRVMAPNYDNNENKKEED